MANLLGINRERMPGSVEHSNSKSLKRHRETEGGLVKQQHSKKSVREDFDRIIHFLRMNKDPQKVITIARACGYECAKSINPTIYQMEKEKLVHKIQDIPPLWALFPTAINASTNITSSHPEQYHPNSANNPQDLTYHKTKFLNDSQHHKKKGESSRICQSVGNKGRHRTQQHRKQVKNNTERHNNAVIGSGTKSVSTSQSIFQANTVLPGVSNFAVQTNQHESLFEKTINDTSAPGAYKVQEQLEHSHEKRMDTYNYHRRHSPKYSGKVSSEQHVSRVPTILHKYTEGSTIPSIKYDDDMHDKYLSHNRSVETCAFLNIQSVQASVEAETPLLFEKSSEVHAEGDDSECTDDEDYDLNFRISDVVSIRDPDFGGHVSVLNNNDDVSVMQNYMDNELPQEIEMEQDTAISMSQEVTNTLNSAESDDVEIWVENGYLGPTSRSGTGEPETDTEAAQKVIDSKLFSVLYDLPLKTTTKNFLASKLHMAQGDLQKLLDICCKNGWIDYSPFSHVRLTEAGIKFISELEQLGKCSTMMQLSSSPPLYPDKLLQTTSMFKDEPTALWSERLTSALNPLDAPNTSQGSAYRNKEDPHVQNNNSDCLLLGQMNSVQEISPRGKKLMPWLTSGIPASCNKKMTCSTELTNTTGQSLSAPSSFSAEVSSLMPTWLSLQCISSTFGQHLKEYSKTSIPVTEYPASVNLSNQSQRISSFPNVSLLSQQEQLQQKRPPLLSIPDTRTPLKCSPGSGKVALLPSPAQSTHQLQPQKNDTPISLQISAESFAALNKNPISAFMEYGQCRHTPARIEVLSQRGPPHKPVFTIAAVLGTRVFPGITSSNKKDGKKDAAEQAIRILIAEGQYNMPVNSGVMNIPESSMTQFDKIAALTHHKFNQLIAMIPESLVGRKVIAGLVMKMNDADTGTVVAIGSGNRCITGDKLSLRGQTVNDCHAEIITRRGFMRFLYHQLWSYDPSKVHPLFEKSNTGKIKVKNSITFHLYISTAPCGDGALFSPRDVESNNVALTDVCVTHRPTFDTNVQGVLRTKMEGGEGTIPVDPEKPVQTWDGIVRGERLRTMSCSDKICCWNVVGLQGALLANFLDPVYLNSITLGFLFDAGHLSRAVCCRLNRGEPPLDTDLPFPYHLNHPALGRVTACDATRETQKTKSYSINWMVEDEKPEIVDGCQGTCYTGDKNEPPQASRLCKKYMFDYFRQTCQILGHKEFLSVPTYSIAKRMNTKFLQAKDAMIQKFKATNCGVWLGKPVEEEMFS